MSKKDINKKVSEFLDEEEEGQTVCDDEGTCYIKKNEGFIEKDKEYTRENKKVIVDNDGRELLT